MDYIRICTKLRGFFIPEVPTVCFRPLCSCWRFFFWVVLSFSLHHQTSISSNQTIFTGQIASIPDIDGSQVRFFFSTQGEDISVTYYMKKESEVKQIQNLTIYDQCMLKGKLSSFEEGRNPNAFNYKAYMNTQRIHWNLKASTFTTSLCQPPKRLSLIQSLSTYRQKELTTLNRLFLSQLLLLCKRSFTERETKSILIYSSFTKVSGLFIC